MAGARRKPADLAIEEPNEDVGVRVDRHFNSVHSLDQSMLTMSSGSPTSPFLFFSLSSLETGLSGTIFKTLPLRTTSTGTPVAIASSRIRQTFSRSFEAVTRMVSSYHTYESVYSYVRCAVEWQGAILQHDYG